MGDQVMDDLIKPELATRMASEVPNCTAVEVADAGHSVPLDNPVGFAAAVLPFLGVCAGRSPPATRGDSRAV